MLIDWQLQDSKTRGAEAETDFSAHRVRLRACTAADALVDGWEETEFVVIIEGTSEGSAKK